MTIDELKAEIEHGTGVPAAILTGETAEENIAQAKAFLAYKREADAERQKSNAEQFAEWAANEFGMDERQDHASMALADIEERAKSDMGGYPQTRDGGEVANIPDPRSTRELFAEWMGQKAAFDPFKRSGNWNKVI